MFSCLILAQFALLATVFGQACVLQVPANPLTASGLATPYVLSGTGCSQVLANGRTFVEAAILDRHTGAITIYHPLVIDNGTIPLVMPAIPVLPAINTVAIWFGSNADTVTLTGPGANSCVNGQTIPRIGKTPASVSIFGQFAYCNAPLFFNQAMDLIEDFVILPPPLGTGSDGSPCPTTRDFRVVDQDQSDNVATTYLLLNGQVAQATSANRATYSNATEIGNGSDNRLLDVFYDVALGCSPWKAPSNIDPTVQLSSLALNELHAAKFQTSPIALVPLSDPMTLNNGASSLRKVNLYRAGVNQRRACNDLDASGLKYCSNLINVGIPGFNTPAMISALSLVRSPTPSLGNNLWTFLAARSSATLNILNCVSLLNITSNPWTLTLDGNGVTTAAVYIPPTPILVATTAALGYTTTLTSLAGPTVCATAVTVQNIVTVTDHLPITITATPTGCPSAVDTSVPT